MNYDLSNTINRVNLCNMKEEKNLQAEPEVDNVTLCNIEECHNLQIDPEINLNEKCLTNIEVDESSDV